MTTALDEATSGYIENKIGTIVDDKIYTWRGMWADKPAMDALNVGNLIIIEDFPPYVGSVWKRAAVPVIFPVAGIQAISLMTENDIAGDNIENEMFAFEFPVDGFFHGTYFDIEMLAQKEAALQAGTFKIYAQAFDDALDGPAVAKTLLHTFTMLSTNRRLEEKFTMKLITEDSGVTWKTITLADDGDLTAAYPAAVTLPAQATASKMMRFTITYQCNGEDLVLKHGKTTFNAG